MDPRLDAKSALNEAVIREIERAGQFGNPKVDKAAIMAALLDGPQDNHQREQLSQFGDMVHIGHPDTTLESLDNPKTDFDDTPKPFGVSAQDLRKSMLSGYEGRGWSQSDVDRAGRMPKSRELSPGSRQFQEIQRRRDLFDALGKSHQSQGGRGTYHYGMGASGPVVQRASTEDEARLKQQGLAASEFNRVRDQKLGESGYMGQIENPEYLAGRVMNHVLNPMVDRLQYYIHDGDSIADSRTHRDERQAALAASRAVSPMLPYDPQGYEEKDAAFHNIKGMADKLSPLTFDQHYRKKTGEYPSLAGSHLATFLENLVDPTTALTLGSGIAKSAKGQVGAIGKALVANNKEEVPMYAGMVGGYYASEPEAVKAMPNWFSSGNLARTDLYAQGPDGKMGEQTPSQFNLSMAERDQEKAEARHNLEGWKRNAPKAPYKTP